MGDNKSNIFFDQLGSIQTTKKYWMDTPEKEKQYNPIGVNVGLSQHIDSINFVNTMNIWWRTITPKMHYDYCFHSIRQMKRKFSKWSKKSQDEDIALLQEYYHINRQRAYEYLALLSDAQLQEIREDSDKGTT